MQVIKEYSGIKVTVNEEDLNKKGVIYLLEFPNGKVYIGQTNRKLRERIIHHCDKGSTCRKLKNAIQKHKQFNVWLLSSSLNAEQLNVYEAFFIKAYNSNTTEGYNLESGGMNKTASSETREKIAEAKRNVSEETRKKISEAKKGIGIKKIKSLPDNIVFNSVTEAANYYGIRPGHMCLYYNGVVHVRSGQTFVRINN